MSSHANQVEHLNGISSGIVGAILIVTVGTIVTYIMLRHYNKNNTRHSEIYSLVSVCALLIEFIFVIVYLGYISGNTMALPSYRRDCALYIDAPISTYSSYTENDIAYSTYRIHGCNAYVLCETSDTSRNNCSLGNAIERTALGEEIFVQDDWLKDAICPHINSYDGSQHLEPSGMFQQNVARRFLTSLYFLCCFWYIGYILYNLVTGSPFIPNKDLGDMIRRLFAVVYIRLQLLPLNALSPVPHASLGCDNILSPATFGLYILMVVFALISGGACLLYGVGKVTGCSHECTCDMVLASLLGAFPFVLMILTANDSSTSIVLMLTTINPRAFSLTLSSNTPRSVCFFCIQVIGLLRLWANVLQFYVCCLKHSISVADDR